MNANFFTQTESVLKSFQTNSDISDVLRDEIEERSGCNDDKCSELNSKNQQQKCMNL